MSYYSTEELALESQNSDLRASPNFRSHWKHMWDRPEWVYDFGLTLVSDRDRVPQWEFSFTMPEGVVVSPDWLEAEQGRLTVDSTGDGKFVLKNTSGHIIEPGADLHITLHMLCPGESDKYKYLIDHRLRQVV
ncbi:hypothetical protein ACWGHD_25140 [Streptomyces xanthophaeus]